MSTVENRIRAHTFLFLRLPTETLKLVEIKLNTIIDVQKIGSFPSNLLIGRPYYHTYEILEKRDGELYSRLRIVPPAELHAEAGVDEESALAESREDSSTPSGPNGLPEIHDLLAEDIAVLEKNNRLTVDDASRQQLSQAEIEELKKSAGGKEVIEKILANHSGLDEKTVFAKAKYMLRKRTKYLKRFTVLPMDLGNLLDYITEKEASRIMEMREETLGLITAWSHAHFSGTDLLEDQSSLHGRWLVADDTGGLVVAALAERLNILYPKDEQSPIPEHSTEPVPTDTTNEEIVIAEGQMNGESKSSKHSHRDFPIPATSNTITIVHPATQPNISLLKHFGYDASNLILTNKEEEHPLHSHLKPLSWLQLLHPEEDPTYVEPEIVSEEVLASWKSGKRGNYYKKRRRWERCKAIVDETRQGDFEGLVVASHMDPVTILSHAVPLVRGGGHVVVYSPTLEPLTRLIDFYSKERRAAYIAHLSKGETPDEDDFPLDPRLLLAATVSTSRVREWQVLPGRTHPLMTSRGGPEGYAFTGRRVVPLEGGVEARGNFNGRKKKVATVAVAAADSSTSAPTTSDAVSL